MDQTKKIYFGRHLLGSAAIAFGVISLVWRDLGAPWQQIPGFGNIPHREIFVYFVAAVEIFGGIAIQWPRTARAGAFALVDVFLFFALLWIRRIAAEPRVYDRYGNFFEQLSIAAGALMVYALFSPNSKRAAKIVRIGYVAFGICVVSFTLVHVFYLSAVVAFTPKWIPPGQMFWAITTTVSFALAAIALLSGRSALLASRLLTAMIAGFGLLVWLPRVFADPHQLFNWAGNAQNSAINGAAWVVADYLSQRRAAWVRQGLSDRVTLSTSSVAGGREAGF